MAGGTGARERVWRLPDHENPAGKRLGERNRPLAADVAAASKAGLWQYFRRHTGPAGLTTTTVLDEEGREWHGVNMGSQDYLGLASDARVHAAAIEAIQQFGVHSSGSAPMGGGSLMADRVAERLAPCLDVEHTLLFPTGWAAGYGTIRGLIRSYDHVVMDALAHNCLQHGAHAATPNVHPFVHNSTESLAKRLARIRAREPAVAILVVTEGLFSMDSDIPDLARTIELCQQYEAHLLVDIAHDFGVLGSTGRGALENLGLLAKVDVVVGSFSKTFASIGGFASFKEVANQRAVQGFSGSYTFSNYLIPPQLGAISAALDIAFSEEGQTLRAAVLENARYLRDELAKNQIETLGALSPMVIAVVGDETTARTAYSNLLESGYILNCIEFPAVRRGAARFRIQLTPQHTHSDLRSAARAISEAVKRAQSSDDLATA